MEVDTGEEQAGERALLFLRLDGGHTHDRHQQTQDDAETHPAGLSMHRRKMQRGASEATEEKEGEA